MARPDPRAPLCAHQHARGAHSVRSIPVASDADPSRRLEHLAADARRAFIERVLRPGR